MYYLLGQKVKCQSWLNEMPMNVIEDPHSFKLSSSSSHLGMRATSAQLPSWMQDCFSSSRCHTQTWYCPVAETGHWIVLLRNKRTFPRSLLIELPLPYHIKDFYLTYKRDRNTLMVQGHQDLSLVLEVGSFPASAPTKSYGELSQKVTTQGMALG